MKQIKVVIGLIFRDGEVLVQRRDEAQHLGGLWEFPGGKVEAGETDEQALIRELYEEVGILAKSIQLGLRFSHSYPDRQIEFVVYRVLEVVGEPIAKEGNPFKWVSVSQLSSLQMPEANKHIVKSLI